MYANAGSLLIALAVDAWVGDPERLWKRIGHPVAWCGKLIEALEARFNFGDPERRRRAGALCAMLVVFAAATAGTVLAALLRLLPEPTLFEGLVASVFLAQRSLANYVKAVAEGLSVSLEEGRRAVRHLVGRNVEDLDEAGVARGAVESLAENFSDGVVAPALAYLFLGLPGLLAYKALNTADSMIGHRSERYAAFGRTAAHLDDIANWVPARLSAVLIAVAALAARKAPLEILRVARRDAPGHRSPNAGWPEAAMASALGVALAGPRRYGAETVDDGWMNDGGRKAATVEDVRSALALYWRACALLGGLAALIWLAG